MGRTGWGCEKRALTEEVKARFYLVDISKRTT